jgi:YggT family protein
VILIFQILEVLLDVLWWIIIVQAIMSWLLAFNVINLYNDTVRAVWQALEKITDPIYRPIRRVMPNFGALDLSPLVVLLILFILSTRVIPYFAYQIG